MTVPHTPHWYSALLGHRPVHQPHSPTTCPVHMYVGQPDTSLSAVGESCRSLDFVIPDCIYLVAGLGCVAMVMGYSLMSGLIMGSYYKPDTSIWDVYFRVLMTYWGVCSQVKGGGGHAYRQLPGPLLFCVKGMTPPSKYKGPLYVLSAPLNINILAMAFSGVW